MRSVPVWMFGLSVLLASGVAVAQSAHVPPKTDEEMIANGMSAAPEAVTRDATILAMDEKGQVRVLRGAPDPSPACLTTR